MVNGEVYKTARTGPQRPVYGLYVHPETASFATANGMGT